MKALGTVALAMLLLAITLAPAAAENWPQWRGPRANGLSSETDLPETWSADNSGDGPNIAWRVKLPGWGASTPVIWGDDVFVTSQTNDANELLLFRIDRRAGKVLWDRPVGRGRLPSHRLHNMASPSPVTDGKHVWVEFGTGDIACFDYAGDQVWHRNLVDDYGAYTIKWGMAGSLLLVDDVLVRPCMQQERSYVVALDARSGKERWKVERKTNARGESKDSYSTPAVCEHDGKKVVVISGADVVTAHDPKNGKEIWRCGGVQGRVVGTPVVTDGMILALSAFNRGMLAIKPGGSGDVTESHVLWQFGKGTPDVPTPVVYEGLIYSVNDNGIALCVDAKSGKEIYRERVGGKFWCSPVAGDGKIYSISESGDCLVIAAGREYKKLATNKLNEGGCLASPAISNGQIFLRTKDHLYCIGKREPKKRGPAL